MDKKTKMMNEPCAGLFSTYLKHLVASKFKDYSHCLRLANDKISSKTLSLMFRIQHFFI